MKTVCEQAGLNGFYTNHSLRSTAATRMYQNQCSEQLIQEVTGHRSLAVRGYKHTSEEQRQFATYSIFTEPTCRKNVFDNCKDDEFDESAAPMFTAPCAKRPRCY